MININEARAVFRREPVSKRLRFEILKRDCFTCQYCGSRAPEVKLNVDHIVPVRDGGATVEMNLVTACADCNAGKAGKPLCQDDAFILFARSFLCTRLGIKRDDKSLKLLTAAYAAGAEVGILLWMCREVKSWQLFEITIRNFLSDGVDIYAALEGAA